MGEVIGTIVAKQCANLISWVFGLFLDVGEKISNVSQLQGSATGTEGSILNSIWSNVSAGVESSIDAIQPVGLALCMLFFVISLLELAMSERMTMEYFIKFLSKLIIGVAAVWKAKEIWNLIVQFGDGLTSLVGGLDFAIDATSTGEEIKASLAESITASFTSMSGEKGAAVWLMLLLIVFLLIPIMGLAAIGLTIVAYIVTFSRVLELCVRGIFLPIACALLSDDGWRGAGGRYLRKILALSSQGAILAIIGKVTTGIMTLAATGTVTDGLAEMTMDESLWSGIGTIMGSFGIMLGVGFASVSLMFKSIGIVNDVFGG